MRSRSKSTRPSKSTDMWPGRGDAAVPVPAADRARCGRDRRDLAGCGNLRVHRRMLLWRPAGSARKPLMQSFAAKAWREGKSIPGPNEPVCARTMARSCLRYSRVRCALHMRGDPVRQLRPPGKGHVVADVIAAFEAGAAAFPRCGISAWSRSACSVAGSADPPCRRRHEGHGRSGGLHPPGSAPCARSRPLPCPANGCGSGIAWREITGMVGKTAPRS